MRLLGSLQCLENANNMITINQPCVGLFGTCGKSEWRKPFIQKYTELGIDFFNSQVPDWNPEFAEVEAEHLANDEVILFPITDETYATGSLAEVGFSILNAIRLDSRRDFVVLIDNSLQDELLLNHVAAKESLRSRALVIQHLKKLRLSNLYFVDTLEEMLYVSIVLYHGAEMRAPFKKFNLKD